MGKAEKVVYVTPEVLLGDLTNYAGGLGILAGGLLSAARDIGFPFVAISLLHKRGYVRHEVRGREIKFLEDAFDPAEHFRKIDRKFFIELKHGIKIWFQVWEQKLCEEVSAYFIDTDIPENQERFRRLTNRLYIEENLEERLLKRLLLGIGTLILVENLKIRVKKFHLNESHSAFLVIELLKKLRSPALVRKMVVATTHTSLPHGHEKFEYSLVERYYEVPREIKIISPGVLELTKVLFYLSGFVNAVSWKHYLLLKKRLAASINMIKKFDYVTNGAHTKWVADPYRKVYDAYIPGWFSSPEKLVFARCIPHEELADARREAKLELIKLIHNYGVFNKSFGESGIVICARRRITGYKRNDILLSDVERLERLARKYKLHVVISGVCHPKDIEGRKILAHVIDAMSTLSHTKLGFLGRNGKIFERACVSGCDIFIHSPIPPYEACGTSWMRAALNAVPTISTRDGGVLEGIIHGYNGWLFGKNRMDENEGYDDIKELYDVLEGVLSLIKNEREEYFKICLNALATIGSYFNTKRVLKEYIAKAYQ